MSPAIVFDTNGLVSAALLARSVSRLAFDKAYQQCRLLTSTACLDELSDVLHRPKFAKYITPFEASLFINRYALVAHIVPITLRITDCRDVKDNKFLEVAVYGEASYLISGDLDLRILHPYRSIPIITPNDFLGLTL
ncbi:putative toxin-antitoxin system toxin component, PIN family [Spirosoma jeollabukense]